jgi:hypothetical protein
MLICRCGLLEIRTIDPGPADVVEIKRRDYYVRIAFFIFQ